MGTRGPAPQPAELRLLKGNGRDRDVAHNKVRRQPKAVRATPPKPDSLNEDGLRVWDLVVPELERMDLLGRIDAVVLEAYCRTYQLWRAHDGGRGYPTLTAQLVAIGSKLGLDPAARLRMTLSEDSDDDETEVFGG